MLGDLRRRLRALRRRAVPDGNLESRTIKSGLWLTGMNVGDRVLQLGLLVVLARLLSPGDFGLLGIALLTLGALQKFTQLGFDQAMIQRKDENVDRYLDTAWTLKFARGLFIAAVLFVAAPAIAGFFNEPRATAVLRVIALSPLIEGLRNPAIVYFRKNLEFHKQFVITLSGSVVNFVVALGIALQSPTVWALVFGFVLADVTRLGSSYLLHGYRPWPRFDRELAGELVDYGKWITSTKIIHFLTTEGDDAVVGWVLTATSLGLYQMAYRLARTPATEITHVVSRVMFPAYSRLQDDSEALRSAFFRALQLTTFLAFPVGVGILVVTPTFVAAILGDKWLPMVTTMQLLAFYGILVSMGATFGPLWKAIGRPDYLAKLGLLRLALMAVAIIPATRAYGIEGAAAVVVGLYVFPMFPIDLYLVLKSADATIGRFLREVSYPTVASVVMGLAVFGVQRTYDGGALGEFVLLIVIGIAVYVAAVGVLVTQFGWGLRHNIQRVVTAVSG